MKNYLTLLSFILAFNVNAQNLIKNDSLKAKHLLKTCGAGFYTFLTSSIRGNDILGVKTGAEKMGVYTYSEKVVKRTNPFNPNSDKQGENCTIYTSVEKVCNGSPLLIEKFESGDIQLTRSMNQEEVDFLRANLRKAEADKKKWKFLGVNGLWEYWENNFCLVSLPAPNGLGVGGDCTIRKKP